MPRNRSLRLAALGSTVQRAASPPYPSSRAAGALRRRLVATVLVVVSIAMLTLYFREADSGPMHSVQGAVASVLHPFQVGAERVARPFRDAYGWTAGLVHARSENEELRRTSSYCASRRSRTRRQRGRTSICAERSSSRAELPAGL